MNGWSESVSGLLPLPRSLSPTPKELTADIGVRSTRRLQAGSERFYPVTGDFATHEMEKCARILRAFTVDGIGATVEHKLADGKKEQKKVFRKIPAAIIRQAKGIVIFTSMRSGIAPFGGAGGAGVIVARLEDGTWSAPSATTPNNLSAGLMLGVDVYDCVLIGQSPSRRRRPFD